MEKIVLKNGRAYSLGCVAAVSREDVRGAQREVMTLQFMPGSFASFESLVSIFRDGDNLGEIMLVNGNGESFLHEGYDIFASAEIREVLVMPEDLSQGAEYQERYIVKLGRITHAEWQYRQLEKRLETIEKSMGAANENS